MSGHGLRVALRDVLPALAREIDGPRRAILAAETHLAAVLQSGPAADGAVHDLQSIDLALQILNDLEGFILCLGQGLPPDLEVEAGPAFRALKLERVAAGLGGALGVAVMSPPSPAPIELF